MRMYLKLENEEVRYLLKREVLVFNHLPEQCASLVNLKNILTKAKKKCASGGTVRNNEVELQGDHRFKLKKFLIDLGFPEENILIQ